MPAFLASAHGSLATSRLLLPGEEEQDYEEISEAENLWKDNVSEDAVQPINPSVQADWDKPLYTKRYSDLLESQTAPVEIARLKAVASDQASAWLNAIPVPALGLKLDNTTMRICLGLRLGAPICESFSCACGTIVDTLGRHGLSCKYAKGTNSRHDHSNDILHRALVSAGVPSKLEPKGLHRTDNERPDGLTLFPWSQGKNLAWDYTCSDTLAWSHVQSNSQEAGKSAEQAEKSKFTKYDYLTTKYTFIPVATETMVTFGKIAMKFIREIGGRIAERTGEPRSTYYLFQSLSIAIQRGNAASVIGTLPNSRELDEIFSL